MRTLVFLHGFLGAADDWGDVIAELSRDHTCVALDLPGHGAHVALTDAQAYSFQGAVAQVERELDARGVRDGVLIGYSLGGRLALQLAISNPGRWRGLVLESASPGLEDAAAREARVLADDARAAQLEREPLEAFLRAWYAEPPFAGRPLGPEMVARRLRNDPSELARALRGMSLGRQPSLWAGLATLPMPTLLVTGAQDAKFDALAARMARLCPRASRAIVSAAGHNAHADAPGEFLRHVRAFLKHIESGAGS